MQDIIKVYKKHLLIKKDGLFGFSFPILLDLNNFKGNLFVIVYSRGSKITFFSNSNKKIQFFGF
jgi:hypothetical protein